VILVAAMGGMMYLTIAPQRKKEREWQAMMKKLRRGHRVLTRGGLYGLVTDIKDEVITLRVADKVEVKVARSAIQELVGGGGAGEPTEPEPSGRSGERRGKA
jgi:preprotein translocase subunit YajC